VVRGPRGTADMMIMLIVYDLLDAELPGTQTKRTAAEDLAVRQTPLDLAVRQALLDLRVSPARRGGGGGFRGAPVVGAVAEARGCGHRGIRPRQSLLLPLPLGKLGGRRG